MTALSSDTTYTYAENWLASSETLRRLALGIPASTEAKEMAAAKCRFHQEECWQEPDPEKAEGEEPDEPQPVDSRPLCVIVTSGSRRRLVGTSTWAGAGSLLIVVEAEVPGKYRIRHGTDTPVDQAAKFRDRRRWAEQLCEQVRAELEATRGLSDASGNPYLAALDIDVYEGPADPEPEESDDYVGWVYEVTW